MNPEQSLRTLELEIEKLERNEAELEELIKSVRKDIIGNQILMSILLSLILVKGFVIIMIPVPIVILGVGIGMLIAGYFLDKVRDTQTQAKEAYTVFTFSLEEHREVRINAQNARNEILQRYTEIQE